MWELISISRRLENRGGKFVNLNRMGLVLSVNVGRSRRRRRRSSRASESEADVYETAIEKRPVEGGVFVGRINLCGDQQADLHNHGGPDKAVHAHFLVHLHWFSELAGWPIPPGYMGENLTLAASESGVELTEKDFCLGDIVAVGSARLQVSQPRIPCFKQADQLKVPDLVSRVVREGRTGLYFRVLGEGTVTAGDVLRLEARPHPEWTIEVLNRLLRSPKDPEAWAELAHYPELGVDLRRRVVEWT